MAEKRLNLNGETIVYDTCKANEVYAAIQAFFPGSAKDWTAELVFPFLATGADANHYLKTLRNVEYNANKPAKKKRTKRTRCNYKSRSAGDAAKTLTTQALFDKE